jgi:hypothetical protein
VGKARRGWCESGESGAAVRVAVPRRHHFPPGVPMFASRASLAHALSLEGLAFEIPNRHSARLPNLTPPKFLPLFCPPAPRPTLLSRPLSLSTLFTRQAKSPPAP